MMNSDAFTEQDSSGKRKIYTIGYSSFGLDSFVEAIRRHNVNLVVDVRSSPYSKFKPEFNRERLSASLQQYGVGHVFLGHLLGARPLDKSVYRAGVVDYELVSKAGFFKQGVEVLQQESATRHIVLMCAEKDPLNCHRTLLISRNIKEMFDIWHIRHDASVEGHDELEERLQKKYGYDQAPLFGDSLQLAYKEHSRGMSHPEQGDTD